MQKWLDNKDILMYSTYNEGKPVITERAINTLKSKIFLKITANNSKSYLLYLNKLVYQYNNTYHRCVRKNLLMLIILFSIKTLSQVLKHLSLKLIIKS